MSRIRSLAVVLLVCASAVALTACQPDAPEPVPSETSAEPTPSATAASEGSRPAISELVLTTEGLGELEFGLTPPSDDPDTNLVSFHNDACAAEGLPGLWLANYPNIDEGIGPQAPFAVGVVGDALQRIDVNSSLIFTDTGIHLGSSLEEVLVAYPGGPDEVVDHADVSQVYVFSGTTGKLQFEIAVDNIPDYWDPAALGTVVNMNAIDILLPPFGVAATGNVIGVCNLG